MKQCITQTEKDADTSSEENTAPSHDESGPVASRTRRKQHTN